jgi:ferredoxin
MKCINCGKHCEDPTPLGFDEITSMIEAESAALEFADPESRGDKPKFTLCADCAKSCPIDFGDK